MSRIVIAVTMTLILALSALPGVHGKGLLAAYDLIGEDAAGDSHNYVAPGVDTGQFSNVRSDILKLEMANDGDLVQFKLIIGTTPAGTGGYMYAVHFKVGGTGYHVCWSAQWTGGQAGATQQNQLNCSFAGETRVGPTTTGDSLQVATVEGASFVRWEVAKSAINDPGPETPITDVLTDTWFRGANPTAPGCPNTSQVRCTWLQADRGPDAGVWAYSMQPAAPPLTVRLDVDPTNASVGPGKSATFNVSATLDGNGTVAYNLTAEGLPEAWNASFAAPSGTLSAEANTTTTTLTVAVPPDVQNQTVALNVSLVTDLNITISYTVNVTVDASLAPPPSAAPSSSAAPSPSNETATAQATEEGSGVPGPGLLAAGAAAASAALWLRRRRTEP